MYLVAGSKPYIDSHLELLRKIGLALALVVQSKWHCTSIGSRLMVAIINKATTFELIVGLGVRRVGCRVPKNIPRPLHRLLATNLPPPHAIVDNMHACLSVNSIHNYGTWLISIVVGGEMLSSSTWPLGVAP